MAVINATLTAKFLQGGKPLRGNCETGLRWAMGKITIPTGTTYARADQVRLVGPYNDDFLAVFGERTIKQVIAQLMGFPSLSTGLVKFEWNATTQRGALRDVGNGGTPAPAGPLDEVELADGFAIGSGPNTAEALFFF